MGDVIAMRGLRVCREIKRLPREMHIHFDPFADGYSVELVAHTQGGGYASTGNRKCFVHAADAWEFAGDMHSRHGWPIVDLTHDTPGAA